MRSLPHSQLDIAHQTSEAEGSRRISPTAPRIARPATIAALAVGLVGAAAARTPPAEPALNSALASARVERLERRIEALERELATVQQASKVKAPFTIVDASDRPILTVDAASRTLRMFDESGRTGVYADASGGGGTIEARGASGASATLDVGNNFAKFDVTDNGKASRVSLGFTTRGATELTLSDQSRNEMVKLGMVAGGGARIDVSSADRRRVASLAADKGRAGVELQDGPGADRATFTIDGSGTPDLTLMGSSRKPAATISATSDGGTVRVFNSQGSPVALMESLGDGANIRVRTADNTRGAAIVASNTRAEVSVRDGTDAASNRAALILDGAKQEISVWSATHTKSASLTTDADGGGGQLTLSDAQGKGLATASAAKEGGVFKAQNTAGNREALMGTGTGLAMLTLRDGPKTPRATLALPNDGLPALVILNESHTGVAVFTHGKGGGGIFQLSDESGKPTVEGGTLANGHGIVRAGPMFQCAGTFAGLVAPDCIMGKAAR